MLLSHSCQEAQSKPQSTTPSPLLCAGVPNHRDFPPAVILKIGGKLQILKDAASPSRDLIKNQFTLSLYNPPLPSAKINIDEF